MSNVERPSKSDLRKAWSTAKGLEVSDFRALVQKAHTELIFNKPVQAYLQKLLKGRHSPVLDVGSNPFHSTYIPKGFDVVALDWSDRGLPFIGKRVVGDVEQIPFPDGSFPIVLSKQVYGYLLNPNRLIEEMARVTKKGGLFLLIDLAGDIAERDRIAHPKVPRLCDFNPLAVETQARALGITNTKIDRIQFWPAVTITPDIKMDITLSCLRGIKK